MDQQTFKKAAEMISSAQNILLIPHVKMDCDAMSSTIALFLFLQKLGKNVTAVCSDPVPEAYQFLPSTDIFKGHIEGGAEDLIVTIDTGKTTFKDLRWEIEEGKVNIVISGENGSFSEQDFSFQKSSNGPDLIISLDTADLPQLGKMYEDNVELFKRTPFLNIDHHVSNTNFGNVNLIAMTNCSTTETLYDLIPYIKEDGADAIDEDIATLLLAGMITDTGSFQHANTTPKSLDIAAHLIEKGARQQEIIKHLFKTKELSTLRLWGRILSKIQSDPIYRMVWSSVNMNDLLETESKSDETEGLIDELLATTPGSEIVLLVREREDGVIATSIRTSSNLVNAIELASQFGGGGHRQAAGFKIYNRGGKSFDEILGEVITATKTFQAERLHISTPQAIIPGIMPIIPSHETQEEEPYIADETHEVFDHQLPNISFPFASPEPVFPPLDGFGPPKDYRNEHDHEEVPAPLETENIAYEENIPSLEEPVATAEYQEQEESYPSLSHEETQEEPTYEKSPACPIDPLPEHIASICAEPITPEESQEIQSPIASEYTSYAPESFGEEGMATAGDDQNPSEEVSFEDIAPQIAHEERSSESETYENQSEETPFENIAPQIESGERAIESEIYQNPSEEVSFEDIAPQIASEEGSSESEGSEIFDLLKKEQEEVPEEEIKTPSFHDLMGETPSPSPETPLSEDLHKEAKAPENDEFSAFLARVKEESAKAEEQDGGNIFPQTEEFFNGKSDDETNAILEEIEAERREKSSPEVRTEKPITPNEDMQTPKPLFEMFFQKKELPPYISGDQSSEVVHGNQNISLGSPITSAESQEESRI